MLIMECNYNAKIMSLIFKLKFWIKLPVLSFELYNSGFSKLSTSVGNGSNVTSIDNYNVASNNSDSSFIKLS